MTTEAWLKRLLGSKQDPPGWIILQSPKMLQAYSMLFCSVESLDEAFATHQLFWASCI